MMNPLPLRVMTYNVHGCVGIDGQRSEQRIAEVIASFSPDIVGLQELDLGRRRSSGADQAGKIAEELGFHQLFHPAMRMVDEQYGDAILSRWPISSIQAGELPSKKAFPFRENRAALWVEIATPCGPVQVMNTHFGVGRGERFEQASALTGSDWIGAVREQEPLIVMGDFNSFPGSSAYKILTRRLRDAAREHGHPSRSTFPTVLPCLTLDYLFVNDACTVHGVSLCVGREARVASDHFPLLGHIEPHCHTRETAADPVGAM